jgi:hypothetical protein
MTTYSRSDLASKALREPGLYGPDEAITGEDQEDAEEKASALVLTLASKGISIPNGSVDAVPEDWYIPLAQYIGMYLLPSFGGDFPTADQIRGAEMVMRQISARPATGSVAEVQFF